VTARVVLEDVPAQPARTTETLLASLSGRLAAVHAVSGADAIGSLVAGLAALGREVARSADGARLRRALELGRAGANGEFVWERLGIARMAKGAPLTPVLDQLRNDAALLFAPDVEEALERAPLAELTGGGEAHTVPQATFLDFAVGLHAFSRELVEALEAAAGPTLPEQGEVDRGPAPEPDGPLLQ
jgi:hypothetical protein